MAAKNIVLTYEDKKYTLEFNRKTIRAMERQGFVASKLEDMPMSMIMHLFSGAFMMHHRNITESEVDKIYESIRNKEDFLAKLSEMYSDPIVALMDEPEEDEGNAEWEASW
jgi:hypothetical protein